MKFFTVFEIARSLYLSVLFGVCLACIYTASDTFLIAVKRVVSLPGDIIRVSQNYSLQNIKNLSSCNINGNKATKVNNVYDSILFLIFGMLLIIHFYVVLDGIFRIYVLIIVILSFLLFKKTFGRFFSLIIEKIVSYIYGTLLLCFGLVALPMYKTVKFMTNIICSFTEPIRKKYLLKKSKKIESKKFAGVKKLLATEDMRTNV